MEKKILHIVRHAKSSWDYENIADIDRPLESKGILKAYKVSNKLKHENLKPQFMISSPANRALHTAIIFARVLDVPLKQLSVNPLLYDSCINDLMKLIAQTGDDVNSIMIFGHNPGFTSIVNHLAKTRIENLPTSGVVTLIFETGTWKSISRNLITGQINHFEDKSKVRRDA